MHKGKKVQRNSAEEDLLHPDGGLPADFLEPGKGPGRDGYAGAFILADVDHRLVMFFVMSVGKMVTVKQIHHKIRDLMYEGLGM